MINGSGLAEVNTVKTDTNHFTEQHTVNGKADDNVVLITGLPQTIAMDAIKTENGVINQDILSSKDTPCQDMEYATDWDKDIVIKKVKTVDNDLNKHNRYNILDDNSKNTLISYSAENIAVVNIKSEYYDINQDLTTENKHEDNIMILQLSDGVAVDRIKVENDEFDSHFSTKDKTIVTDIISNDLNPEEIATDIKSETEAIVTRDNINIEEDCNYMQHPCDSAIIDKNTSKIEDDYLGIHDIFKIEGASGDPEYKLHKSPSLEFVKVENVCEMSHKESTTLVIDDVVFIDKDYSSDDTSSAEVRKTKQSTRRTGNANGLVSSKRKKSTNAQLPCDKCPYKASSKRQLLRHASAHDATETYSCYKCNYITIRQCNLARHFRLHSGEKPFSCDICHKDFDKKCNLATHLRKHTGKKSFSCRACHKIYGQESHLVEHLKTHFKSSLIFSCDVCSKKFNRKETLTKHLKIHSGEKPFTCDICNKKFSQKAHLATHVLSHSGEKPFQCTACNKAFNRKAYLKTHARTHSANSISCKIFSCKICRKGFNRKEYLTKHMRIHSGEKPFSCDICEKTFKQKAHLTGHVLSRHKVK